MFDTKRSPIVLMAKFAVVEAVAFLVYFLAALLSNANELYTQLSLSNILSYSIAKMFLLSGVQFALTVYAFLSWYYEYYRFDPGFITHFRGVFFKREWAHPVDASVKFTAFSNGLEKLFHCGSIRVGAGKDSFLLSNVSRPEMLIERIKHGELHGSAFRSAPDIHRLLKENEHEGLEFKSSLRYDYRTGQATRDVEKAAMKTVAAMLNSKGGHLVLGVNDKREPVGIANDYGTLQRKDSDGFENHFTQAFNNMIGPGFRNLIKLWFHTVDGYDLCVVQASPSPRPVYFKVDNSEHFYVRTGNISAALKLSEMEAYARARWPRREA